jgi:nucleoside phosphorylase
MLIVITDDDGAKRAEIIRIVREAGGESVDIREAASLVGARRLLRAEQVDLLVLDIALPERDGGLPQLNGGISLLREVVASNRFKMPAQVIGLTALDEVYEGAVAEFGGELWSVLRYNRASSEWAEQLATKVRHLLRVNAIENGASSDVDLGIVVALKSPELDAVLELPWHWKKADSKGDPTVYHIGEFKRRDGTTGRAVVARTGQMGMPAATALGMKLSINFRPRLLAMVGICAGSKDDTAIGDLVVANPTWDYGSGKYSTKGGKPIFEPAPYPLALSSRIRGIVEPFEGETEALAGLRRSFKGTAARHVPRLHIGPFASGSAVVARAAMMQEVQLQHRKLLAIDMEAYGVAIAAAESLLPVPEFLILKGVSDFADEDKGDSQREYAAFMSAQLLALLSTSHGLC